MMLVKAKIQEGGIPPEKQTLLFGNRVLENDKMLADYNIHQDFFIGLAECLNIIGLKFSSLRASSISRTCNGCIGMLTSKTHNNRLHITIAWLVEVTPSIGTWICSFVATLMTPKVAVTKNITSRGQIVAGIHKGGQRDTTNTTEDLK
ncbi:hypothetical protein SUGI_0127820 [Cryptomeria japonica]|nr:hypothetical protein SUGI_0127820 [Cryptomeria japonica]